MSCACSSERGCSAPLYDTMTVIKPRAAASPFANSANIHFGRCTSRPSTLQCAPSGLLYCVVETCLPGKPVDRLDGLLAGVREQLSASPLPAIALLCVPGLLLAGGQVLTSSCYHVVKVSNDHRNTAVSMAATLSLAPGRGCARSSERGCSAPL